MAQPAPPRTRAALVCVLAVSAGLSAGAEVLEISPAGVVSRQVGPGITTADGFRPLALPRAAQLAANQFRALYARAGAETALSPDLIEAIAFVESRHNPQAVSPKGARGLMQLMPGTAASLGVDAADPSANVAGGASYLRSLLDRYRGDLVLTLAAYNAGPGAVARYGGVPPFRETQNYIAAVLERLAQNQDRQDAKP